MTEVIEVRKGGRKPSARNAGAKRVQVRLWIENYIKLADESDDDSMNYTINRIIKKHYEDARRPSNQSSIVAS